MQPLEVARGDFFDDVAVERGALGEQALVGLLVVQVGDQLLVGQQVGEALEALVGEDADFVGQVPLQAEDLGGLDGLVAFVLFGALAAEDFDVDDGALDARRAVEGGVANVAGLFAEDGAEQFLFRGQRGFALGRDLADQDVAGANGGADADDAALVEIAQERFADVGDIARDFFGAELGVAGLDFELLDVDGGVVILFDQLFADQDGVFKVVTAPGQEGHQHVAAQGQFAAFGARAVGQHLALAHAVAHANQRLLVDAGILVGALELGERVDVGAHFAAEHAGVVRLDADDDALGVHLIDDAIAACR